MALCALAATTAGAQTFSVANADGVEINYQVTSADNHTVQVASGTYAGRVAVPDSVDYSGARWAVTSVGTAFKSSQVTTVALPATVTALDRDAFAYCGGLDTLRFASPLPMGIPSGKVYLIFDFSPRYSHSLVIEVPCGSLAAYRRSQWGNYRGLRSVCAVRIDVVPSTPGMARFDSINLGGNMLHNSSGWYEVGDTAVMMVEYTVAVAEATMLGWSCGSDTLVVQAADSVVAFVEPIAWATLNANNISTPVSALGTLSNKNESGNYFVLPGYEVSTIFASALWMAASGGYGAAHKFFTVSDISKRSDYTPGPLRLADASFSPEVAQRYNRVWRVSRQMIDDHIASLGQPGYTAPDDILTWPAHGPEGYAENLAPFYDADGDGRYDPYSGDYPIIRGDVATFSIFNDMSSVGNTMQGRIPMGVEVHAMHYAFDEPQDTALANAVFVDFTLFNRSANTYDSTYLGAWTDFDIGSGIDDYIGSHISLNMFYAYNSSVYDQQLWNIGIEVPPAQGCIVLESPADGNPLSSFIAYDNSNSGLNGEPTVYDHYYNYLRACWRYGEHLLYGGNGLPGSGYPTNYMYAEDSEFGRWAEWELQNTPGDRRGVGGVGPFTFEPGTSCSLTLAHLTAQDEVHGFPPLCLFNQADLLTQQFRRDTTASGRPFTYMPYSPAGIDQADQPLVAVFPNPATSTLTVALNQPAERVDLYDIAGCLLLSQPLHGLQTTLDLASLRPGVYILRVGSTARRVVVAR